MTGSTTSCPRGYVYSLVEDDQKRKPYRLGMGQGGTMTSMKNGRTTTTVIPSVSEATERRGVDDPPAMGGDDGGSNVDVGKKTANGEQHADTEDECISLDLLICPHLPGMWEEIAGLRDDAANALNQVIHAFYVSPDDIDAVAKQVHDAQLELEGLSTERVGLRRVRGGNDKIVRENFQSTIHLLQGAK
ncbi:hypothetical protein ACHAWF_012167 [Thalassiosira exigua]